jgi:prevent-host-death family protein
MRANIRELKDHLSTYIHDVRKGKEVVITSHGVPVAKLSPILTPETTGTPSRQRLIQELEALHKTLKHKNAPILLEQVKRLSHAVRGRPTVTNKKRVSKVSLAIGNKIKPGKKSDK